MIKNTLLVFFIFVDLFLVAPTASADLACLDLTFYRKDEDRYYYYFVDNNAHSSIYYRTSNKDKFAQYYEGDSLLVCAQTLKTIDPPQKYLYGVKDYTLDITREIKDIQSVSLSSSPAFKPKNSSSPNPQLLSKNDDISHSRYFYTFLSFIINVATLIIKVIYSFLAFII